MVTRLYHVDATESRTLCGSSVVRPSAYALPFDQWISHLTLRPEHCCGECRRVCMQSQDRARFIRNQEALYGRFRDIFDQP